MTDPNQKPAESAPEPRPEVEAQTFQEAPPSAPAADPAAVPDRDGPVDAQDDFETSPWAEPEPFSEAPEAEPEPEPEPDQETVIAQLLEQVQTSRDKMLRAMAEAENTRRRAERDRQDIAKYALTEFARELLSPADNLRRALDAVPADSIGQDAVLTNLNDGVAATERELLAALEKIGVKKIDSMDQKFDPNFHQAMFEVPDSGKPAGIIVQVIQEGFILHDRLLRPALVGVAKADPAQKVDTTA